MESNCKFCGKKVSSEKYLSNPSRYCGECSSYCMKQCPKASLCSTSWHKEPCVSCEHNPYRIKHTWSGKEWIKK